MNFSNPDFSQVFIAKSRRYLRIPESRGTGDAGILASLPGRLFRYNAIKMNVNEVIAENLREIRVKLKEEFSCQN
ncbi:MAG: hypothetical protein A2161_21825 [Candidatus Schekmanbacteria bacterium RBG_13_48_7]|uniref:Uncharacterized protein n=1 Tax=Candidatus Schekmanbacteria bacterium RBG_13_48_7 TaxID=1817878 RepID=A0A1F7S096_9BACT|nr:MAG: hypothetical protein A2161_21825 [Candidatus Schekmanbacteria bacterium RBG_13_48_7]